MYVTIHTPAAMARDLRLDRPTQGQSLRLQQIVSKFGLHLEAMHPDASDPELASLFYILAPDAKTAAEIRRRIEEAGVIEAVYVKPPEGPPSA